MAVNVRNVNITGSGAGQRWLGPNPRRKAIIIRGNSTTNINLKFAEAVANNQDGLWFGTTHPYIIFTRDMIGEAICLPLFGLATAAAQLCIMEVTDDGLTLPDVTGP